MFKKTSSSLSPKTRQAMYVERYEARSRNHCCHGKAISIKYSERVCILDLVIQHAKRMRRIMSSAACPPLQYFPTLSHKRHDFRGGGEKKSFNIKCVSLSSLQLLYETFLILRRTERDIITNVHRSSCKVPVILVGFQ